jgi:hypothetical protein
MNRKVFITASLLALLAIFYTFGIAYAHTTVQVGDYEVEVGWVSEPPIIGQQNAVVVNVSDTTSLDAEVDVSNLIVNVTYGDQTKTLTLQPLSEESTNQYVAPILPTIPGQYTVQLRGKVGDTDANADVQIEEVESADVLAFPSLAASQSQQNSGLNWSDWLAVIGLVSGLGGLTLGFLAFRRSR